MKVRPDQSRAAAPTVQLVTAIANYAKTDEEAVEIAARVWPQLGVYRGHTHLRLMLTGKTERESVYVELG
jgi:hypothetical protein